MKTTIRPAVVIIMAMLPLFLGMMIQQGEIPITTASHEALVQYQKGMDLSMRLRSEEAIPYLHKAVSLDPNFAMAYYFLAMNATTSRDAMDNINKATSHADQVSEGERTLIKAMKAGMTGDLATQEQLLRQLVTRFPNDKTSHITLAGALYNSRNYPVAIDELQKAIAIDANLTMAYNLLGYAHMRTGNLPEAETDFRHYTTQLPDDPNPHDSFAELLMKEGKFDQSIAEYQKALAIAPNFHSSRIGIAVDHMLKGMPVEARKNANTLFSMTDDPGWQGTALTVVAETYITEGQYQKAIDELNKVRGIAAKNDDAVAAADALTNIGRTLLVACEIDATKGTFLKTRTPEVEKIDAADVYFKDARKIVVESKVVPEVKTRMQNDYLVHKAQVELKRNNIREAKATIDQLQQQPGAMADVLLLDDIHMLNGLVASAEKRFNDAVTELSKTNLHNPMHLYLLAEAYNASGNTAKAAELRTAIWNFNENSFSLALVRPLVKQ